MRGLTKELLRANFDERPRGGLNSSSLLSTLRLCLSIEIVAAEP